METGRGRARVIRAKRAVLPPPRLLRRLASWLAGWFGWLDLTERQVRQTDRQFISGLRTATPTTFFHAAPPSVRTRARARGAGGVCSISRAARWRPPCYVRVW